MLADDIRSIPLFANLSDGQRGTVASKLAEEDVELGAVLARQGDFAYHHFVVREGRAAVIIDGSLITTLEPGSSFGEIGVLQHGRRTADVVAITPMRLLTLTMWDFNALADEMPGLKAHAKFLAEERLERA